MNKPLFNQRKALRFRRFARKGYALFASLGRVVIIGVLSVATLQSATAAHRHTRTDDMDDEKTKAVDKEATIDDVEVTGARAPLALGQAARIVTVLSREDIQAAPVQSINDLLKMAVGVDVRQRGPIGAQTDVAIRGGTSEQITILLNGINICDPQTGHNTFDLPCDLSDIVRTEVLEGPAGRVYGTSSLVGAINIVTKTTNTSSSGSDSSIALRAEGGSYGYLSTATQLKHRPLNGRWEGSVSASYTRSDGYSRTKAGTLNSDYEGMKAFHQGCIRLTRDDAPLASSVSWHAGLSSKEFGSNTFYSAKYDNQFEKTTKLFTALQGDLTMGSFHCRPSAYWNRSQDRFELIRGVETTVPFNRHHTNVYGFIINSWFDWLLGRTAFGAEFRNEDLKSSNLGEPKRNSRYGLNRSNISFHLEHNVMLKRFTLSAGFVTVKNSWNDMPFRFYPGIDASYRISDQLRVYASYNSSLRMPSFTELYYSVGGHKADKYLKPEELRAMEGGMKYDTPWLSAKASVFHHHARNMIDWVMDTRNEEAVWQSVNHTRLNTLGEEFSINLHPSSFIHRPSSLILHLSYCHLHQQKQEEAYLQSRYSLEYLRHKLTAGLSMPILKKLLLTLNYRWQDRTGTYTDTSGMVQAYRPYSVFDSRLAWNANTYSIYIEGNNLLNHHYVDYGNVRQPGIWLIAGVRINTNF